MSERLLIDLAGRTRFAPDEEVPVAIGWELPGPPEELTLELIWATAGRGRTDRAAVLRRVWRGGLAAAGAEVVPWRMPAGPLTREGKLVSIGWVLRLHAKGEKKPAEVAVVLAPPGPDA